MQGVPSPHPPGLICIISGDLTRYAIAMQAIMSLQVPAGSGTTWDCGVLVASSLNTALGRLMASDVYEWAWLMGDDHTFPPGVLLSLLGREKDAIAPLCLNRVPPMDPNVIDHARGGMKPLYEFPTSGLYKLGARETVGDAGLLIRKRVLERIEQPFYDHRQSGAMASEDQAFTQRIKDAGFDIFIDVDNPIGHVGNVTYGPVAENGSWRIRLIGGLNHICDLDPRPRK